MLKRNIILVLSGSLILGACGLYNSKPSKTPPKQHLTHAPYNSPWILRDPPHVTDDITNPGDQAPIAIKNPETLQDRVEKLENEMAKLKLDFAQIDARYGIKTTAPKPVTSTLKTKQAAPQKVSKDTGVRFGLRQDKTRIVIDLPYAVNVKTDLDNEENFLMIELSAGDLNLKSGNGQGLISSYDIDTDTADITRVILNLKADAKIIRKEALLPSGSFGHRFFIDISK